MARKRKIVSTARESGEIYSSAPLALNQWCIEMAMQWPCFEDTVYGGAQNFGAIGNLGGQQKVMTDADIIGRATKIMDWVKKRH